MRKILMAAFLTLFATAILAQTNDFNYQGTLNISGQPANGSYDFEFRLFTAESGGSQISVTATRTAVTVTNGVFNIVLAFPLLGSTSAFPGADRWLEIAVRQNGSGGGFQQLLPRTKINSSPYAITAANAANATNATNAINATTANNALQLGGVTASEYVTTTSGSANFIQNTTSPQAASNFNISGNGTAGGTFSGNIVNATTQYNINGNRILSTAGFNNVFAGLGAGAANTTGADNSFFGRNAGFSNTGGSNSFFGAFAGQFNTTGIFNAFFGARAGRSNTTADSNSFFGNSTGRDNAFFGNVAGADNTTGSFNVFVGSATGDTNTNGSANVFVGYSAGTLNTEGDGNTFLGSSSGTGNTSGGNNAFVGRDAGDVNTIGFNNSALGKGADFAANDLSYATAIGSDSVASLSNSIYLGRPGGQDAVRIPGATIMSGSLVIGTLGSAGSTSICLNAADRVSPCSSSLRYKTNIGQFGSGLNLINQLIPITFDWKDGGMADLGLVAEDVAAIEPLLTTTNDKGEIEGVKYDRIGVVLVNAVKEQQAQIDSQKAEIAAQRLEITSLKQYICSQDANAPFCKEKK